MSQFSVSGLASGLDTNALIDGLMFAERATVRRLESSKATETRALDAWADIETRLETLAAAATAISSGGALDTTVAQSSDETVLRVSAQPGALAGAYAFTVDTLAAAEQQTSDALSGGSDLVGAGTATATGGFGSIGATVNGHALTGGTYTLRVLSVDTGASEVTVSFDGVEQTVSTSGGSYTVVAGDGGTLTVDEVSPDSFATGTASITVVEADGTTTVSQLAAALNAPGGSVRAQVIDTGDGTSTSHRLVITSRQTGVANAADVDLSQLSLFAGGMTTLRAAADASITLGDGGLTITRPSNSIGDLFEGLSIDLVGTTAGEEVEIIVSADTDARIDAVREVIDAVSGVLRQLATYSRYDVDAETGGPLVGNFTARSVAGELTTAMSTVAPAGSFVLLSQLGVSFQQDGTYTLDEAVLQEALATDPAGVQAALLGDAAIDDDGVLDVVANSVDALLGDGGRIPTAKETAEGNITALDALIANQEVRLENVEARFRRQFTALEQLIGQLQSQSNYLSSLLGQQASQ